MTRWKILESGRGEAAWNMAVDEALLAASEEIGGPVLRFYGWTEAAATFGYFQHYKEIADWTPLRPLIRRTTGGGLVPHDADWTYSVIIPPNAPWYELRAVESYRRLHEWVAGALQAAGVAAELAPVRSKDAPGQCFIGAEQFDVVLKGRKIAGAAQRRAREGLLIQGSVQPGEFHSKRPEWERAMRKAISADAWELPNEIRTRAEEATRVKYSQATYNQRR